MKKTNLIILGAVFMIAVSSCSTNDNNGWTYGADANGRKRDTFQNGAHYRYYGGGWYPVYTNGMIYPRAYNGGYNYNQISHPGFRSNPATEVPAYSGSGRVTTSGFGSSAHASGGAGE